MSEAQLSEQNSELTRVCLFCGETVIKSQFGNHNKKAHSILRFEWMPNGVPGILVSSGPISIASVPMHILTPPLPNLPPPIALRPIEPPLLTGQHIHRKRTTGTDNCIKYDMDISGESDTSDNYIEGTLFEMPSKPNKDHNFTDNAIDRNGCLKNGQTRVDGYIECPKSMTVKDRPKLSSQINDNSFELILSTKVFSTSDSEYGEFPVSSNYRQKQRHKSISSTSTLSSNGTVPMARVTNEVLKKIVKQAIEQHA